MRIGQFEIAIKETRKKPGASLLASCALGLFIYGMLGTHWLLSWRISPSILTPQKRQLIPYGPVVMHAVRGKGTPVILFYGQDGKQIFKEQFFSIPIGYVVALAKQYAGQPVATLWTYQGNPDRKVWAIDVNGERILKLTQAIREYQNDNMFGYGSLGLSLLFVVWDAFYALNVRRTRPTIPTS